MADVYSIAEAVRACGEAGYDCSGDLVREFQAAYRTWAESRGLNGVVPTGRLDSPTLLALRIVEQAESDEEAGDMLHTHYGHVDAPEGLAALALDAGEALAAMGGKGCDCSRPTVEILSGPPMRPCPLR
jgi:hypothetical protein